MKRLLLFVSIFSILLFPQKISAEEIIRYTANYELEVQERDFNPSTEDIQEWFNIDLPRDENGTMLYTLEFDTSKVDYTKVGEYEIVLTFYKSVDHKYQKAFKLLVVEPEKEDSGFIGAIEVHYIKQVAKVFGVGLGLYIVVLFLLNKTTKKKRYIIVYDNKVMKTLKSREVLDENEVKKRLNLEKISSYIVMDKTDVPSYLEEMLKKQNYDYVIEIKH